MATLILGVHNHQPVGNFDFVVRDAHERAYAPFLEVLARHERIKLAVHISGPLLEWQKREAPAYLDRLGGLVARGQVELFGGGYWEPILAVLPERDQHAQIERMSRELESLFGARPRGLWLAERIWEPSLPRLLAEHGLDYVALDDGHFLATGFAGEKLHGYYLSEEGGRSLAIFPISMRLRYLVPFHPVARVLAHLRSLPQTPGDLAVLMDDGEKFGVWSSTHALCYEEGYLEALFTALEREPDLVLATFAEYRDSHPPLGWAYLPTASYTEMGQWALPLSGQSRVQELSALVKEDHPDLLPFVRGGFWRNFFVKYEESHWMHKRMLHLGERLARAEQSAALPPQRLAQAEDLKLQAQCNCAYWHGLFGGLYLPHLRQAVCERLVQAEAILADGGYSLERRDLDLDGHEEIVWTSPRARLWLKPADGGRVRELDFLARPFPLTNVLTRREELYHAQVRELEPAAGESEGVQSIHEILRAKEAGLDRYLLYDPHGRASLEERLYAKGEADLAYAGGWWDVSGRSLAAELPARADAPLTLSGRFELEAGRWLRLEKRLAWEDGGATLAVSLTLGYDGPGRLEARWASGWNFNFLAPDAPDRRVLVDGEPAADPILRSRGWERDIGSLTLEDAYSGLSVTLAGESLEVYREPVETVSLSEAGFERVYQGSWLALSRMIDLESGQNARLAYRVQLRTLGGDSG